MNLLSLISYMKYIIELIFLIKFKDDTYQLSIKNDSFDLVNSLKAKSTFKVNFINID